MPEGNEIHRFARDHAGWFAKKRVRVDAPNGRFAEGASMLDGLRLRAVDAYGKHLFYDFGTDRQLHVHLGLYGWFWDGAMPLPEPKGALRLRIYTAERWIELRGPTACEVLDDHSREMIEARIGPDPLRADADPGRAIARLQKSKTAIGALLMDQAAIAGIGNIYRAELLFRANLNPYVPGTRVAPETLRELWNDAVALMPAGMRDRRIVTTRPADRPHPKGRARRGETHYVYRRRGLPCLVCTTPIESAVMVGRNVFWCPNCQPPVRGASA
jgi:endonuclease-8